MEIRRKQRKGDGEVNKKEKVLQRREELRGKRAKGPKKKKRKRPLLYIQIM